MIQLINVSKIENHPHNPRKDLGDLNELASSIKQSGILQNLTIVPWFSTITGTGADDPKQQERMGYYALIGNRRLAAAKIAGLTEVPCAIANMDEKTQIATMLLENMQRSDLTVFEQAQGFQMMLNLGETIANISEKTGFSDTTVRRRMKLLELDQDKLKASAQRGATLTDYIELEKIENIELRNSVLEKLGTSNFNYELKNAIDKEKRDKEMATMIEKLEEFAERIEDTDRTLKFVKNIYGIKDIEIPEDASTESYFFKVSYSYIWLCKKNTEVDEDTDEQEQRRLKEEKRALRNEALKEVSKRAYELRYEFVKNVSNTTAKKNIKYLTENIIYAIVDSYLRYDIEDLVEVLGIDIEKNEEDLKINDISEYIYKQPERFLLASSYVKLDGGGQNYFNYQGNFVENEVLNRIYDLLIKLEYVMSKEELALRHGTHELFEEQEV